MASAETPEVWGHFLAGQDAQAASGRTLRETDPSTGEPSFTIAAGSADDVAVAVASAKAAFPKWRDLRPMKRGQVLQAIARAIRANADTLVAIDWRETGRKRKASLTEIESSAQFFELYGGLANVPNGDLIDLGSRYHSYVRQEPFGVVGIITPWNVPMTQAARAIAPALAVGNAVVVKPSEFTSVSTLFFAKLAGECGLPAGVLNVVTGTGPEVGGALARHDDVRKLAFTGSTRIGREIGKIAAERIVPVTLELGGKSANIIFDDADIAPAVASAVIAFTTNAGQLCSAGTRLLVQDGVFDAVSAKLKEAVAKLTVGSEDDDAFGPIITQAQFEKVKSFVAQARGGGAEVFVGGDLEKRGHRGFYVDPMLLIDIHNDAPLAQEELFGPILSVIRFRTEADAIRMANDTPYGLAAGVWTNNLARAHRVAAALEAGQVYVNEYFAGGVETPFGGYKMSGIGREKGYEAMRGYMQSKSVTVKL